MELVSLLAEQYAERYTTPHDDVLRQVHLESRTHAHAHLLSTETQGALLSFLSWMMQPTYILEVGTFTGYSALCLCKGLKPGGELHTIELRQRDVDISSANFKRAEKEKQIHLHIGNAVEIIPSLDYEWDIVFIDADKTNYISYYELALARLSNRGIVIADNVLFHGQVLQEPVSGKSAKAIHDFNQYVINDERVEIVMLTIRDGLMLIRKK